MITTARDNMKKVSRFISLILMCVLLITTTTSVAFGEQIYGERYRTLVESEKENNEKEYCLQNFNLIEAELTGKGTSIEDELSMFYQDFESDTKQLKNKNIYSSRAMNSGSKQVLKSIETVLNERESIPLETYYLGLAGAIIAWFNYKDYKLSAELLNYSTINKTVDSYYYPTYGSQVMASNVYKNIKKKYIGTFRFRNIS